MNRFFDVSALGQRVRIAFDTTASDQFVQRAKVAWGDALVEAPGDPDVEVEAFPSDDEEAVLARLSVDVTRTVLKANSGSKLMFHAAGIAAPDGRVIAFVGMSGRGKTTLMRTLAKTYGYVSDETIAIDDAGAVVAYRKPLSLVREGQPKDQVAASSLDLRPLPEHPLRLAALVVLDRLSDPTEPRIERVPLVEVIQDVVEQMSYLPELERPLQSLAALADSVGGFLRLTYSESAEVLPLIEAVLAGRVVPWDDLPLEPALPSPDLAAPSAIRIGDVLDAVGDIDSVCVLSERTVHVLGGIAPAIWWGIVRGLSREETLAGALERYGVPVGLDADVLLDAAIDQLCTVGLVARESPVEELAAQ